jgi:hypothetical protein
MDVTKVKQGNYCATSRGHGRIVDIDKDHHLLLIRDYLDEHDFVVRFDEVLEDPQVHTQDDIYY